MDYSKRQEREDMLRLANELEARRASDPLLTYPLHQKQKLFCDSVLQGLKKENWFIAANRAGKSAAGAYCGAHLARFGNPNAKWATGAGSTISIRDKATSGWVSCLDFPTARDVMQPKYFDNGFGVPDEEPFIPVREIEEWRVADQILKLKNGSLIGFKSADSGRKKYQGAAKDWFHMDEEHPWDIYEEAVIRVGRKPLVFFATATILPPEGRDSGSASWVFSKIIQPYQDGRLGHIGVFGASIYDNPGIAREEIKRLESIYPEGSLSRRIRLEGEWLPGIGGARAYASFERTIHVREQPPIQVRRPLCWVWDFNVEPLVSLVGQFDGNVYRVYRELILDEGNIPDMCQLFYDKFPSHQAEIWLYGDSTGNKRTGQTGRSDYYLIMNEMKRYGAIKMKIPNENPKVPDRINAMNRIMRDEDGQIRFQVDPSCQELIGDFEGVLRDQRGGILKTHNRKDPYFRRTHTSDAVGYWIAYEEPVRPPRSTNRTSSNIPQPNYGFNT